MTRGRVLGGKRLFLIHGSAKPARNSLSSLLTKLGFDVVILSKQEVRGAKTLIEKFELVANTCNYAVALFTPDDKTFEQLEGDDRFRARQNVLIELGWFMAHLGRERTYIVVAGDIEMPSDIVGIEVFRCGPKLNVRNKKLEIFFGHIARSSPQHESQLQLLA